MKILTVLSLSIYLTALLSVAPVHAIGFLAPAGARELSGEDKYKEYLELAIATSQTADEVALKMMYYMLSQEKPVDQSPADPSVTKKELVYELYDVFKRYSSTHDIEELEYKVAQVYERYLKKYRFHNAKRIIHLVKVTIKRIAENIQNIKTTRPLVIDMFEIDSYYEETEISS